MLSYHTCQPEHGDTTAITSKPNMVFAEFTEKGADVD
jgi:hypothetical protein